MKRTFLIIVMAFLMHTMQSQNKWAPIGAEWYYNVPDQYGNLFSYEKYVATRDTLIEEKQCVIVESEQTKVIMYEENHKVYYRYGKNFNLIYDYSVNVGDTVAFEFKSFSPNSLEIDTTYKIKCVVESISNLDINNQTIKKYTTRLIPIEELDHLVWSRYTYRERIGYEYDFMYVLAIPAIQVDNEHRLRCYSDDLISLVSDWWRTENKPCDYSLASYLSGNQINGFQIFPNPVLNEINITSDHLSSSENFTVMILDATGKVILVDVINSTRNVININGLDSGIYIIQLHNNSTLLKPFKIIKL